MDDNTFILLYKSMVCFHVEFAVQSGAYLNKAIYYRDRKNSKEGMQLNSLLN